MHQDPGLDLIPVELIQTHPEWWA
ncbi:hypothetical protein L345_03651, partial [Ophiophagus hannah]